MMPPEKITDVIPIPLSPIAELVFEGGGVKGLVYAGALKALEEDPEILKGVQRVAGSSAGAMTALMVALGYTQAEIEEKLKKIDFSKFKDHEPSRFGVLGRMFGEIKNIKNILGLKRGYYLGKVLHKWIEDVVAEKLGNKQATFEDLDRKVQEDNLTFKHLFVTATNCNTNKTEIFSHEKHKSASIADAVLASTSIPRFFQARYMDSNFKIDWNPTRAKVNRGDLTPYVDGGELDNDPIEIFNDPKYWAPGYWDLAADKAINPSILNFRVDTQEEINTLWGKPNSRVAKFFLWLSDRLNPMQSDTTKLRKYGIQTIQIPDTGIKSTQFSLTDEEKEELQRSGYEATSCYIKNYRDKGTEYAIRFLKNKQHRYLSQERKKVTGVNILGDSITEQGGKDGAYNKKILGIIPFRLFLDPSPFGRFTNGFVWADAFEKELTYLRQSRNPFNPLENPRLDPRHSCAFKFGNKAQGGAMAYDYSGLLNFFKFTKGFFLSLVLTNMQSEAKELKKDKKAKLNPDQLCIIFAGANDLVTAGYGDKGGAKRAIQGIAKTIEVLTTPEEGENYAKYIALCTLPNLADTPREEKASKNKKTAKQRKELKEACDSFNEGLRELAKSYQYLDFSLATIYQADCIEDVNNQDNAVIRLDKIKGKAIILVGTGNTRVVYFVDQGKFVHRENGQKITIEASLSKAEETLLGSVVTHDAVEITEENTIDLRNFINKLASKAKLNTDIKIFDAAAIFEKIKQNPEDNGFTSGCAVYYLNKNQDKECISQKIKSGNAVIIQEINQELICYFVKDGRLMCTTDAYRLPETARFKLSEEDKSLLYKKIKAHSLKESLSQLAGCEDEHDLWTTHIVQQAVKAYEDKFKKPIQLTDIYASVLLAAKKHFPNKEVIFWDDLHPSVIVHFLLETRFKEFFVDNYDAKLRLWTDDMAISDRASLKFQLPSRTAEAPHPMITLA
jgi:NTE family protein